MAIFMPPPMMPFVPPPLANNDKSADQPQQPEEKPHGQHQKAPAQKMPARNSHLQNRLVSNMRSDPRVDKMNGKEEKAATGTDADGSGGLTATEASVLHAAIKKQDVDSFNALLSNGVDVNALDLGGKAPLDLAVQIFEDTCRQRKSVDTISVARFFVLALLEAGARSNPAMMARAAWAQRWRA